MNRLLPAIATILLLTTWPALADDRAEFCAGFEEGYKTVKGSMVIVPICPIPPITPIGSTPFREGIKAGINAAR